MLIDYQTHFYEQAEHIGRELNNTSSIRSHGKRSITDRGNIRLLLLVGRVGLEPTTN